MTAESTFLDIILVLVNAGFCLYTFFVKIFIKVGLIITGILAVLSFLISVSLVRDLLRKVPLDNSTVSLKYHFALYLPSNQTYFFAGISEGAQKAARENNVALTVHPIDSQGTELRMASYTGVDGIVVCPNLDDDVTLKKLEKLRRDSIPLVLINHNIPADQPWPFIGTNNFDFGRKAGALVNLGGVPDVHLAVVYSEKNPAIFAERELVEMGISGVLGQKLGAPISSQKTDMNPRDAEKIVYELVRTQPALSTIVFTDTNDTLAGTQALIDLNLVGRVQIIGFGADEQIKAYIRKGIISASLVVNPELIGYQAIKSLVELCSSGFTSNSVDTGIDILTREKL